MAYRTNFRNNSKRRDYKDSSVNQDASRPPEEDGSGNYDDLIAVKAKSNLPMHPVTLVADPYTNALPGSYPYSLLNKFNKIIGGRYSGFKNLDGGNVKQYANSVTSKFLNIFDTALLKVVKNYRYLPIRPYASDVAWGADMIDEMRKAIAEATSVLGSTIFTNQGIYYYGIQTDMPMGSATPRSVSIDGQTVQVYTEIQDVIYALGVMYQTHLQSITNVFSQFNAFRMKQGEMIRMSFNRETPALNSFFGLMNKKAFLSLWDSLAFTIEGEYVDLDFMTQSNMLGLISSRRSESMNDPLLEITSTFAFPNTFKVLAAVGDYAATATEFAPTPIFDIAKMYLDIPTSPTETTRVTFAEACDALAEYCTAHSTLTWVRGLTEYNTADNERYNQMKSCLDVLTYCMTYFKVSMNDFRTVLDVMAPTGTNQWTKSVKLKVTPDTDMMISQNLVVDNIFSMVLGGDNTVTFNNKTKRWGLFTLWNQYYGIPEHDTYSGGIFITLSTKAIDVAGATDTNVGYIPKAFYIDVSPEGTICTVTNRLGEQFKLGFDVVNIDQNPILSRLVPLQSQADYEIRVPTIILGEGVWAMLTPANRSFLAKIMLQITGTYCLPLNEAGTTFDYGLDNDIFSVYDLEVEDFTNEVITYARTRGIFRANSVDDSNLGFYGMRQGHK